jgi:hypothetical protein
MATWEAHELPIRTGCSKKHLGFKEEATEAVRNCIMRKWDMVLLWTRELHTKVWTENEQKKKKTPLGRPTLKQILRDTKCNDVASLAQDNDK